MTSLSSPSPTFPVNQNALIISVMILLLDAITSGLEPHGCPELLALVSPNGDQFLRSGKDP